MAIFRSSLDMCEAYDRVQWNFPEAMLLKLRFLKDWVNLVMTCVCSVSYRIKVNGELAKAIVPQPGLRQGDSLSPYLFLLCAEGFSSLLHHVEETGMLTSILLCQDAPSLTHLLFADNSLILMKADESHAHISSSIYPRSV